MTKVRIVWTLWLVLAFAAAALAVVTPNQLVDTNSTQGPITGKTFDSTNVFQGSLQPASPVDILYGGTNATTASGARTNLSVPQTISCVNQLVRILGASGSTCATVTLNLDSDKTLTSPTISGTVAGGASYTGPTLTSPTISGTTTLSGMTTGSVLFSGASSALSQDNTNLFWDDTTNRLKVRDLDATLQAFTKAGLPAAGTAGRLARVTDDVRGPHMDAGTAWLALNRRIINVKDFGASTTGTPAANVTAIQAAIDAAELLNADIWLDEIYEIDNSLVMDSVSYTGIRGSGWFSGLKNLASASKPSLILRGKQYFHLRDFVIFGVAANPNDAIKTEINGATRTAFGMIENLLLEPNGLGIHLTDTNTVTILNVSYWPSGASWLGATSTAGALDHFVLADGTNDVNDIHILACNAITRETTANGGRSIRWNTTTTSTGVYIKDCELEEGTGANTGTAILLRNVFGFSIVDNYFGGADVNIEASRYGEIARNAITNTTQTITIGDGTAGGACIRVLVKYQDGGTLTIDSNNSNSGAEHANFETAYTNNSQFPVTINVSGPGGVDVAPDQLPRTGLWLTPAFAAGDFTASGSMTWTLTAGDVTTYQYMILGKTMYLQFYLVTTTTGGTASTALKIKVPAGKTINKNTHAMYHAFNNAVNTTGVVRALAGATTVDLYKDTTLATNWTLETNLTEVYGQIFFEIQ